MKNIIFLLYLFTPFSLFSQDKLIVDYDFTVINSKTTTSNYKLYIDNVNQISLYKHISKNTSKNPTIENINGEIRVTEHGKYTNSNFFNYKTKKLISVKNLKQKGYLVTEEIPKMSWNILNERKKIGKHEVQKAETVFRGKKYIAWFTDKYPIKVGPWKFHGLSGLIIEMSDENEMYNWKVNNIKIENFSNKIFEIENPKLKPVTLKEYVYEYDNGAKAMAARMPKEATNVKVSTKRSLELKYEWEK